MKNTLVGVICAFTSAVSFGSTYVPLKWFEKSDGIYFQWVQSLGQLLVGVAIALFTEPMPIHPIAMLGGMFFTIGNSLTIYIINGIGLVVGYLLWNSISSVCGWAIARFGLFRIPKEVPYLDWLNVLGIIVVCVGSAIYSPIKHIPTPVRPAPWQFVNQEDDEENSREASGQESLTLESVQEIEVSDKESHHHVSMARRIFCLSLTIVTGIMYGNVLTPISYVIATEEGASTDRYSYMLSFFIGSFCTATFVFAVYSAFKKNRPLINPELSLPSLASGLLNGIALTTFFMANQHLDQIVAYPILMQAPGIVVSLWAIFLFREIRGKRNIIQLYFGIFVTLVGIVLISLSKSKFW